MSKSLVKEKIEIDNIQNFSKLEKLLLPAKKYVTEKKRQKMYDDYNEYTNSFNWFIDKKQMILNDKSDNITAYCIKNKNKVIGIIFSVMGTSANRLTERHNIELNENSNICQLICFHIEKNYRGIGKEFLQNYVFEDLKKRNINTVLIKSSHHKCFSLYERLGKRVGIYFGLSEHKLYRRQGNVYKIDLV